jgi:hypothetical protein
VRGGDTPNLVQELAGSGFPQAEDPEENFHFQGGKALPISILERDNAARSAHRSVDMSSHKFRRGPKGDNAVVRGRGEGDPRKGGTHIGHLASGRHRDPVLEGDIDGTTLKGVSYGGDGAATMREGGRQDGREGTKRGPGIMPNRDGAAVTRHDWLGCGRTNLTPGFKS